MEKDNDLYNFYQSEDLNFNDQVNINLFKETIYSINFRSILKKFINIELSDKIDISCSKYIFGNYLLCHDDDIKSLDNYEGRRLAFIYYLVDKDWNDEDGGHLQIFNT